MNPIDLIGLRSLVFNLVSNDKRMMAYELLDYVFSKATTMNELDVVGELSLKTEYRDLYFKCAESAYSIALTTQQRYAARTNLIKAYGMMNYPEKALHYIEQQLLITPNNFELLCEKAANTSLMGNKEQGEKMLLDLLPKYPQEERHIQSLLSGKYLREGNLVRGISVFTETYKGKNKLFDEQLKMKRWNGIAYPNRTIYVDGEGGIGDEIINIRFFENIKKLGMNPILYSPNNKFYKDKNDLFKRHGYEIQSEAYSIDRTQFWVPMMSLPAILNLTEEKLWNGAYLSPLHNEKNKLTGEKFKIGIKCSGNPYFAQDEYRKIPLDLMLSYLPNDVEIYYIDKIKQDNDRVINLADKINSWEDTLDFIDQMDCIVSSCTSLVHAAGAIGKTTFVAVPIFEYYIWSSARTDNSTPWYGDNFHVMKQTKLRDWNEPLQQISEKINQLIKGK